MVTDEPGSKLVGLTEVAAVAETIGTWMVSLGFLTSFEKSVVNKRRGARRLAKTVWIC